VNSILGRYDHFPALDAVFLIGFDPFTGDRHPMKRMILVGCPNSVRTISPQLYGDSPIQLYTARPFVLPMRMEVEKGRNTMFQLKDGTPIVENTRIFDLF